MFSHFYSREADAVSTIRHAGLDRLQAVIYQFRDPIPHKMHVLPAYQVSTSLSFTLPIAQKLVDVRLLFMENLF